MKLFFNYSTGDACTFPKGMHTEIVWSEFVQKDDDYDIFDISHWTDDDTHEFMNMNSGDQLGILENLTPENIEVI